LKTALIKEYTNKKPSTASKIYCQIYKYRVEQDLYSKGRWWVRLSKHKTRCLKDLFCHTKLKAAFNDLLGIPRL
ncbi:hypothetical protein B0J14DRAFT_494276, partial [Halenospora varia]